MFIRRLHTPWDRESSDFEGFRKEMDRLLNSFTPPRSRSAGVYPALNIRESADALNVRAELPGVDRSDLDISIEKNTLTIAGKRQVSTEEDVSYHRRERGSGEFRRSFSLPIQVDPEGVDAQYKNGILTLTLPKAAAARPRQIEVRV